MHSSLQFILVHQCFPIARTQSKLPVEQVCDNNYTAFQWSCFSIPTVLERWFWKEQKRRKAQQLRDRKTLVYTFCDYCMIFLVFVVGKFETADTGRAWWGDEWRWWRGRGLPSSGSRWVSRWVSECMCVMWLCVCVWLCVTECLCVWVTVCVWAWLCVCAGLTWSV